MAGFGFSEPQEMFRRQVRSFVQKEIAPNARIRAKQDSFPPELARRMGEMGLLGINQPEKYGGQPADWVTLGIAVEEVARGDFSLSIVPTLDAGIALAFKLASEDVQAEWLPRLISGEVLGSVATTEPGCGSDVGSLKTRAVREGDHYILNGEKTSITVGMQSEFCIVFAKTDPTQKARGVTAFLVPLNSPGVHRSRLPDMGCKPMGRCSIILDNVKVPLKYRMGGEGKGFYLVMGQFDLIRVNLGLMTLGCAQVSLEDAMKYAQQRTAFGNPLAKYEGISFKIAEDYTRLEAARLLCYRTLWLKDQGQTHTKESAMCKFLGPKVAVQVIHDALLIHGHVGYSEEHALEQRLRDVIGWEMADGTAEVMKIIISRELMGREFLPY
ncbi:MAG: acyl-CoA dehydrogenase family protein [Chloroflexi bacterium]|nr:acyl-CoA dehydrogenase family protein [Chloroflexota bacterium]